MARTSTQQQCLEQAIRSRKRSGSRVSLHSSEPTCVRRSFLNDLTVAVMRELEAEDAVFRPARKRNKQREEVEATGDETSNEQQQPESKG